LNKKYLIVIIINRESKIHIVKRQQILKWSRVERRRNMELLSQFSVSKFSSR